MKMSYWRFAAMIATSTVVMFGLMYLNTYAFEHVFWSETRAWMALVMGAVMAVVMLAFMRRMYPDGTLNLGIFVGSGLVFVLALWLVRSQATVGDSDYMEAMIPHHSIAVLTSERSQISDPRVRKLADEIIAAQRREIAEMRFLIGALDRNGDLPALHDATAHPRVVAAEQAIRQAEVARIDLAELDEAEIREVVGDMPTCRFGYSRSGPAVAAAGRGAGSPAVVKINGRLVAMSQRGPSEAGDFLLEAEGIEVAVEPEQAVPAGEPVEATALLHLDAGLRVGYAGYVVCTGGPSPGAPAE